MEDGGAVSSSLLPEKEKEQGTSSYTYWVREVTQDAAPPPVPRKLTPRDILSSQSQPPTLGSVWNQVHSPFSLSCILMSISQIYNY